jgi:hypothetical protein
LTFNPTFLSLERALREGALVRWPPERPLTADSKRELFAQPELLDLLKGIPRGKFPDRECEKLIGIFCAGYLITVSFKKQDDGADMKRLEGFDEVWALCPRKPRPGWRVFGRFVQPGCFVAFSAWDRHALHNRFGEAAADVINRWRVIFDQQEPYRGSVAADYLTGVCKHAGEFK